MNYILADGTRRNQLLPFTFTRPVAEIRVGILTIREKWERHLDSKVSYVTESYLSKKYTLTTTNNNVIITGSYLPTHALVKLVHSLKPGECIVEGAHCIAYCSDEVKTPEELKSFSKKTCPEEAVFKIEHPWDLFALNGKAIHQDFELLTAGRKSQPLPEGIQTVQSESIFLEEGAVVNPGVILNAKAGPIYLAKDSEVMEGSLIRGPFSLGEHAVVKMGAKIYGPTTAGPYCKLGGEVNNSILMGYSNKGHDGYLGNSVLGEWCNLGADTNTSNLKNNYANVKLWDYTSSQMINTGQQFCGLMMGDHSKCGINTMFNTGTVVGVAANIFDCGFPVNHIPSFSWGGKEGFTTYRLDKAFETLHTVMQRRQLAFDGQEQEIIEQVFKITEEHRKAFDS